MKKPMRLILPLALCAAAAALLAGCDRPLSVTLVPAPPGPADLGPATGLSTLPPDAVAFDLKYRPETGGADDIRYFSFWGYGGSRNEATTNSFLQEVRQKAAGLYYVQNPSFPGRQWAAVEYHGRQVSALYFDLNANGHFEENERIPPTRAAEKSVDFITPDFMQTAEGGGQTLCRALLQANFWGGGSEPNCMWSPAAVLEGKATLNGRPARVLLYADRPGGTFERYGASSCSLLAGEPGKGPTGQSYVPRETLSSLIASEGRFYRLSVEGRRSNGLPARVVLLKDTSPTGVLAVKLASSNALQTAVGSLYLSGANDKTVFFRLSAPKEKVSLPVGTYAVNSGAMTYGTSNARDWEVSFSQGPRASIQSNETAEVALGHPTLKVRAIEEKDRYGSAAVERATFKAGTRIYLEPRVAGKSGELLTRFRHPTAGRGEKADRPPKVTITGPDGKQVLSTTMEYG